MDSLIYAGVVLAGAITLLIEAYRNFNGSLSSVPFREHPILQHVEVEKLCTRRERNIGFMFYSLLYLVTYTVVLSSTSVMNLLIRASENNEQIGPRDQILTIDNDPFLLGGTDYGTPIFVSAAIIAIFSLGALRPVESTMRSLAHRLAGVPRGVYEAIERLHDIKYTRIPKGGMRSFTRLFEKNYEEAFKKSNHADHLESLRNDLLAIDYLSPAIVGTKRLQFFPFTQLETMHELSLKMEERLEVLRGRLEDPIHEEENLGKLIHQINAAFNDSVALFAVNFLRNNRSIKSIDNPKEPLSHVYEKIRRDYRVEMNSFAMAMLFSLAIGIGLASFEYSRWTQAASPLTDSVLFPQVKSSVMAEVEKLPIPGPEDASLYDTQKREILACLRSPGAYQPNAKETDFRRLILPDSSPQQLEILTERKSWIALKTDALFNTGEPAPKFAGSVGDFGAKCHQLWMAPAIKAIGADRQAFFFEAFKSVFPISIAVMLAGVITIFARDVRRDDNSWADWSVRRPPFLRLVSLALLPAVLAVFGVVLGDFLIFWFETEFRPTEQQITNFFISSMHFHAMHLGVGFLVAIGVLFLTDNHLKLQNEWTILIGVIFAALICMWYLLVVIVGYSAEFLRPSPAGLSYSFEWRETKIHAAQPAIFMIVFAMFLEITERKTDESNSLIGSLFKRRNQKQTSEGETV